VIAETFGFQPGTMREAVEILAAEPVATSKWL
jgi:hypothetical protein